MPITKTQDKEGAEKFLLLPAHGIKYCTIAAKYLVIGCKNTLIVQNLQIVLSG